MKRALLIGGLDPSAGAGIVLDAFVAARMGFAPMTVATVLTAQNSAEFLGSWPVERDFLRQQLQAVAAEGEIAFIKIGAVGSAANASEIARFLVQVDVGPVVFDPVLASSSGGSLLDGEVEGLSALMRACDLITPNRAEAARLLGLTIDELERPAVEIAEDLSSRLGVAVLVTGVRSGQSAVDVLACGDRVQGFEHQVIAEAGDPRGTGCALATAIAARLCSSDSVAEAVVEAQEVLLGLVSEAVQLGAGRRQIDFVSPR